MKKLSLTRETLKQLSADQAQGLAAGMLPTTASDACPSVFKTRCQRSFRICWVSELYTACCATTVSRGPVCQQA